MNPARGRLHELGNWGRGGGAFYVGGLSHCAMGTVVTSADLGPCLAASMKDDYWTHVGKEDPAHSLNVSEFQILEESQIAFGKTFPNKI